MYYQIFGTIIHWLLSVIEIYQTLCTIRHWVCLDIGYVQTLGMFRHWVRSYISYVQTLGMFRHWACSDIRYVETLRMSSYLPCSDIGYVHSCYSNLQLFSPPSYFWPAQLTRFCRPVQLQNIQLLGLQQFRQTRLFQRVMPENDG